MISSTLKSSQKSRLSRSALSYGIAVPLVMSIAIWWSPVAAETTNIFGPMTYTREAGPPQTFTAMFDRCGTAACELIVTNGADDRKSRVSSASILLNGEEVVGPRDFNKQVGEIVRPVGPDDHNELRIRISSKPGSFLTVEVRCAASPVELFVKGNGVDTLNSNTLISALRIGNSGMVDAENVEVISLMLTDGTLTSPASLPYELGTIPADGAATLNADFSGAFAPPGTYSVDVEGTYEAADATFCFALNTDLQIPHAAPGSAALSTAEVPAQTVTDAPYPPQPPQFNENVNRPFWSVPIAPPVPGTPTDMTTGIMTPPDGFAPISAESLPIIANDVPAVVFRANSGGIDGGTVANSSTVAEPSGASDGDDIVFVTANWFAAFSTNGGGSFTPINPTTVFPADTVGFCCDQVVQYVPSIDRFIWLLQGSTTATQLGGYRLAAASPADLESSGATAWTYWNLTPAVFGQPTGTAFDYPDMSVGNEFLYVSWDAGWPGCPSGCDKGFQVVRIPLSEIQSSSTIHIGYTDPTLATMAWGAHIAQNPGNEVFWAGHNTDSQMRVFTLAESSNSYFWRDVGISTWATGGLTSTTPDAKDWMDKLNGFPRHSPHGLARSGNELWFAWSAGSDDNFPRAHVEMVTLDNSDYHKIRQVQIWNGDFEFGYPALSTNACTGEIGLSLEYGGNGRYENHAVGFLRRLRDDPARAGQRRRPGQSVRRIRVRAQLHGQRRHSGRRALRQFRPPPLGVPDHLLTGLDGLPAMSRLPYGGLSGLKDEATPRYPRMP
jgi:hypothetical protein